LASAILGNVLATNYLWQEVKRGPKRKFLRSLLYGKPIEPTHETPPIPDALPVQWFVGDDYRKFFHDFAELADMINEYRLKDGA
jgi:hypothetical protein